MPGPREGMSGCQLGQVSEDLRSSASQVCLASIMQGGICGRSLFSWGHYAVSVGQSPYPVSEGPSHRLRCLVEGP